MASDMCETLDDVKLSLAKKDLESFRVYEQSSVDNRVAEHYRDMRMNQTVAFYKRMEKKYSFENGNFRCLMTVEEAFDKLESYVDASDPDFDLPNRFHLLQTAEAIRHAGHPDWFQLVGLLHDMGKIMFLWGTAEDGQDASVQATIPVVDTDQPPQKHEYKQWALGGDTFVVGCKIPDDAVVFPQFNILNPDMKNPLFNTECGIYKPRCGLDQLCFAWGHDEYMYRMLNANQSLIPEAGLDMIRYHSAYPMHDKGAYSSLLKPQDEERLEWVRRFNQFDLYTKDANVADLDMESLWPYYRGLLNKYGLGGNLKW